MRHGAQRVWLASKHVRGQRVEGLARCVTLEAEAVFGNAARIPNALDSEQAGPMQEFVQQVGMSELARRNLCACVRWSGEVISAEVFTKRLSV